MSNRYRANGSECLLLVEGSDDKAMVIHLGKVVSPFPTFYVSPRGSVEQVLDAIGQEVRAPGRKAVGIVVDANESRRDRWRSVRGRLEKAGVDVPMRLDRSGTIIQESTRLPRVGIWVMPDNTSDGELEDFAFTMLPDVDPVWPRSVRYIDEIPREDRRFKEKKERRAKLYAWLATREKPRQMGLAIEARDLQVNGTLAATFVDWLRTLFGDLG